MHDRVRGLWICDDCGYRYQAKEHLDAHLVECYQFLNSKGPVAAPVAAVAPAPAPVVEEEPASDRPVRRKPKES